MKYLGSPSLLIGLIIILVSTVSCKPYTVEGQIVGKVFEPAYAERIVRYPMGGTRQVGDKWYIEIAFADKNGQSKTFYWGVTKEAYDAYSIGDKTPVNVESEVQWNFAVLMVVIVAGVIASVYILHRKLVFSRLSESEETEDEFVRVREQLKGKPSLSIFGIVLRMK